MKHTEQRKRLRSLLAGSKCSIPASVFDPLSVRVAESVGYQVGLLAGSVAASTTLAAPDLIVLTLSEFADQIRRIMRVGTLSLMVDADHGYGNALNVMRTVREFEHAGVSALSIQDTVLPEPFGQQEGAQLISVEEMVGKLRAAVAARQDPSLVIVGRTTTESRDADRIVERARAYAATGIDMIFVHGAEDLDQVAAIHEAVKLPIMVGPTLAGNKREDLAACGVRVLVPCRNYVTVAAAVKALRETYEHLFNGGNPRDLNARIASQQEMARLVDSESYQKYQHDYLRNE